MQQLHYFLFGEKKNVADHNGHHASASLINRLNESGTNETTILFPFPNKYNFSVNNMHSD